MAQDENVNEYPGPEPLNLLSPLGAWVLYVLTCVLAGFAFYLVAR